MIVNIFCFLFYYFAKKLLTNLIESYIIRFKEFLINRREGLNMKLGAAKIFRVLTVPPLLVACMVLFLLWKTDVFSLYSEALFVVFYLAIIPALAYILQPIIPVLRDKGRSGQRILAMILSVLGYSAGVVTGYVTGVGNEVQLIYNTYLLSVVVLVIFNCFDIRASGHACSVAGPLIFLGMYGHYFVIPFCVGITVLVVWSSLVLNRHTVKELILGALVSTLSLVCMCNIM